MEKNNKNDNRNKEVAPFITVLYELVNDRSAQDDICWSTDSTHPGFVVLNPIRLSKEFLPKYLRHSNYAAFVKQMEVYGFQQVEHPLGLCYMHPDFKKGHKELLYKIHKNLINN
ncbi:heat shock transcription factor, putative [Entamoeba invadens IP1]|uniref:Heat shock transcription factor, putative n=1 Tax=Entamoeba invadens IP1 TaxID=370355 RepID=A0A0A1TXU5_ENTIV|nr:heat shock transcription factor, putative [Entamoeba invadens IP1]ELP86213.1 heat shock transcription factor, putative [Entamoeba invadens IP1]|eukprot:XP_004185559.1 heat shock transcription factor, putative [Entamoeba invadens IP1]